MKKVRAAVFSGCRSRVGSNARNWLINQTPGFKEKYLELLKSGGKDYPLELLKIIDINLEDNKVFESAIDLFKETLEEFKNIYLEK